MATPMLFLAWFFILGAEARAVGIAVTANTTWTKAQSPIIVSGSISINAGVKLTVEPGVIIKLSPNNSIIVLGELDIQGSAAEPVIITSIKDDNAGGYTNADGAASAPAPGDWYGIMANSPGAKIKIDYAKISYGGGYFDNESALLAINQAAELQISHSQVVNNKGYIVINQVPVAKINYSNIFNPDFCLNEDPFGMEIAMTYCGGPIVFYFGASPLDAANNYWGHEAGPTLFEQMSGPDDIKGTAISGDISYQPFLGEPWQAAPPEPDPIVLVPGIGACLNLKVMTGLEESSWDWDLVGDYYQGLIKTLEAAGFTQGEDLFIGCYDWRKTNGFDSDAAVNSGEEYLRHWIDEAKEKSGAQQVDIIVHSMGGLVARSYIQSDRYQNDVDQLIMLGTPNHGSSFAYFPWEGGEIPQNWQELKKYLTLYLTLLKFKGLNVTNVAAIHEFIPSVKQLLPTYDYLFDTAQQILVPSSAMVEANNWLNNLNSETEIAKLRSRVRAQIIYGDGRDTLNQIPVSERGVLDIQLGKWIDGKPVAEQVQYQPSGDGTVLSASASLSGVAGEALSGIKHSALPDQAALKIMREFGIPSEQVFSSPDIKSELMFLVASPVFPLVTTPDGAGQIGYDAATGNLINTIDGARYFSAGDGEAKLIIIPNPIDGEYSLELTANADGQYHLASGYFSDTKSIVKEAAGEVADEQVINYPVNLQSTAGDNILPELMPEKEEESVVINRVIADIEAMLVKGWIKNKQSARELIQPLKRLSRQLDSINKQTAQIKKLIDKINANAKIKPKAKEKILQALNKRLVKLPIQRAKFIERDLGSFSKNLENLRKKNKININGYNALIKSINILRKTI